MRSQPAQKFMRKEQVSEQRTERIEQRQVREQVVEVRTPNAHLAAVFARAFLRSLLCSDSTRIEGAEGTFLQNLDRNEEGHL